MKKKIFMGIVALLVASIGYILYFFYSDAQNPYVQACDYDVPTAIIPTFKEVPFNFNHKFNTHKSLPLMGSCMIDVDDDGIDEVFIGGGVGQQDVIYRYKGGFFEDISEEVNLPEKATDIPTLGAISFDIDNNGQVDLLLARADGVWWAKNEQGKFTQSKLKIAFDEHTTPVSFTLADVNKDGFVDIFLCNYISVEQMKGQTIFNDTNYGATSKLLLNNGDASFRDVTTAADLAYIHNTFQAIFVDIDDDTWLDLVVAYDTGEARTYKNTGNTQFQLMPNPLTGKFAYPMGIAVGDYNNDTKIDFFFSNTGTSVPAFAAKGDLRDDQTLQLDWLLFKNEGNFEFSDQTTATKIANFEFSWGCVFEDFNLDGRQDLLVAENYIDYPPHKAFKLPCRFLLQREEGTFSAVEEQAGLVNKNYAITPLISDFNNDGYPDLIYVNLDGPVRAFINNGGNKNFIKVKFAEIAKNAGAKVNLTLENGEKRSDVYIIGEGLACDQTNTLTFGLGNKKSIQSILITYPSGKKDTILSPKINTTIRR